MWGVRLSGYQFVSFEAIFSSQSFKLSLTRVLSLGAMSFSILRRRRSFLPLSYRPPSLYARRVNHYCRFAVTALPDVRNTKSMTVRQQRTAEGEAILRFLYAHNNRPQFQVRFRWQKNSIAFWDNRCVQHIAMWDYFPNTRSGNRVTVQGDRPY